MWIHLNIWQRLGIVASVLWVLVGATYFDISFWTAREAYALQQADAAYKLCHDQDPRDVSSVCLDQMRAAQETSSDQAQNLPVLILLGALLAFVPVLAGWACVYLALFVFRLWATESDAPAPSRRHRHTLRRRKR
jgi:hypothetical protein